MHTHIDRSQFIRGNFRGARSTACAAISTTCLAKSGVVCRTCGEVCDAAAIRFTPRVGGVAVPTVDGALCTGCGDCVAPCPVGAVTVS